MTGGRTGLSDIRTWTPGRDLSAPTRGRAEGTRETIGPSEVGREDLAMLRSRFMIFANKTRK